MIKPRLRYPRDYTYIIDNNDNDTIRYDDDNDDDDDDNNNTYKVPGVRWTGSRVDKV